MNVNKIMQKDRSGIGTILIVVIVVVVLVAAAAAAYVVLSGNNDNSSDEAEETTQILAPGTVMKYDEFNAAGLKTGTIEMEILGQNADEYFLKVTVMTGMVGAYSYNLEPKDSSDGATKTGTIQFDTIDGLKTLDVWTYPDGTKSYVDPESGIEYGGQIGSGSNASTLKLSVYSPVWQDEDAYTESSNIGKTYEYVGTMTGSTNNYAAKIVCVADCKNGQFGVMYDLNGSALYFLSNNIQGLPTDTENTGVTDTMTGTIDGDKAVQLWKYPLSVGEITFCYDPASHLVYRFVIPQSSGNIDFDLSKKP
ncbi:MAG: hypothetical protein FWG41_01880 [Methanomassiliicoccaceae archaeon]|nr:hypothetical protein [Methanomassiliicoccaceae archaeon]